ncbi:MAG TPA: biotin/lipoyl-containing protein, partial [Chitinophagaceae bacterium]
ATYLKAIEAGVDVVDCAIGALSGLTSQPNFNAVVEMMKFHERANPYDIEELNRHSTYWEAVREYYYPFESGLRASSAEVYYHEIPGGQYSNLKPQAAGLGLGDKMEEIKKAYRAVNEMFGDIVKVTPSSKVVGDMALFMVSNGLTVEDIYTKGHTLAFPESVVSLFKGEIGQPVGGFDARLQQIILKDVKPFTERPNEHLAPVDFEKEFKLFKQKFDEHVKFTDLLSYLMYPKVFEEYHQKKLAYGSVRKIPTPQFFYGLKQDEEALIEIDTGKAILVRLLTIGEPDVHGMRKVFMRLNGQTRIIEILDRGIEVHSHEHQKAEKGKSEHIAAPLQGKISQFFVKEGEKVKTNTPLFTLEAMKMESTITALKEGTVKSIVLPAGTLVKAEDLVMVVE